MSGSTDLYLPPSFPYPVKIVSIDANSPTSIQRGTRLLSYSFVHLPSTPSAPPETRFGTWDSTIEGTVDKWNFKPGDVISERKARDKPVVSVIEPCKHGVQIGGLCGLCGKDMTEYIHISILFGSTLIVSAVMIIQDFLMPPVHLSK